jgi:hypothetical protein
MTCEHCNGTGSLSKSVTGFLDCIYCNAAEERAQLEVWARRNAPSAGIVDLWAIYQHGKAAGAAQHQ